MLTYKCASCGGQMEFGGAGGFACPFCGSRAFMSDKDFEGNERFRAKLLSYYKSEAIRKESDYTKDRFWEMRGTDTYTLASGQALNIEYMDKQINTGYTFYIARQTLGYVFETAKEAAVFKQGLSRLAFPPADTKLARSFPELKSELTLEDQRTVLVYKRNPNFYPASLFAPYESVHLAWIISRMENICCALAYAGITHGGISPDTVFINPVTHEGALFGDWRNVNDLTDKTDLISLRKTAIELARNTAEPKELYRFLNSRPASDAFEDFKAWDKVIEQGFGGHNFVKM